MKRKFPKNRGKPTPKQIYKTLKTKKNRAQNTNILPDVEILNNFFLSGHFCPKKLKEHLQFFPIEMQPKNRIFKDLMQNGKQEECRL